MKKGAVIALLFMTTALYAQLIINVSPPVATGNKAMVKLELVNQLNLPIDFAKAVVFIIDEAGKVVAQNSRWVIGGGDTNRLSLPVGATNTFHFVVKASHPIGSTNLTPKVVVSRLTLSGGKAANPLSDVLVTTVPQ